MRNRSIPVVLIGCYAGWAVCALYYGGITGGELQRLNKEFPDVDLPMAGMVFGALLSVGSWILASAISSADSMGSRKIRVVGLAAAIVTVACWIIYDFTLAGALGAAGASSTAGEFGGVRFLAYALLLPMVVDQIGSVLSGATRPPGAASGRPRSTPRPHGSGRF